MTKERPESAESGISSGHDRDNSMSPAPGPNKNMTPEKSPKKTKKKRSEFKEKKDQDQQPSNEEQKGVQPKRKRKPKNEAEEDKPNEQPRPGSGTSQGSNNSYSSKKELGPLSRTTSRSSTRNQLTKSSLSLNSVSSKGSFGLSKDWDVSRQALTNRPEIDLEFLEPLDLKYECPVCCQVLSFPSEFYNCVSPLDKTKHTILHMVPMLTISHCSHIDMEQYMFGVLRFPVQFEECGHRCCSSCLPELLRVAPRCPIDQSVVQRDKVYPDKAFQTEIDNLGVKCANNERGCKWQATLSELLNHDEECNYSIIQCPQQCDAEFERRFLTKHIKADCQNRVIPCDFCGLDIKQKEEMEHLRMCELFLVPCPNGCKRKEIPRAELPQHMEFECPKQGIECPFAEAGCEYRCNRKEMDRHIKEKPDIHLEYVGRTLHLYKQVLDEHKEMIEAQTERLVAVEGKVESLEKLYGSQLIWKIEEYGDKLIDAKSGKKTTIYSPAFLTSRYGYKMALSASLYGDGKARGKYMSMFVCIMKGDYDSLLAWPFNHRVTFTLIDQCQDPSARRNVTYTVKPNICKENKPFLGRPKGERNASFGAQKFVELDVIKTLDYIRDDTIYIKVSVDSENMIML